MSFPHFHTADSTHAHTHTQSHHPSPPSWPFAVSICLGIPLAYRSMKIHQLFQLDLLTGAACLLTYRHHLSPKSITIIYSYTCIWMILQRWDGAAYITLHPLHVCTPIVDPWLLNRHLWAFKFQQLFSSCFLFSFTMFHRPSFKLLQQLRRDCVTDLADENAAKSQKDGCKIDMENMACLWVIYCDTQ